MDAYPPIDVAGIAVPTSHPAFLGILAVHVAVALVAVVAAAVAAASRKGPGRHPTWGSVYFWSLVPTVATAAVLTALRPAEDWPLLVLGAGALACAVLGREARRRPGRGWIRVHLVAMSASVVAMLTAFYVDNGPHLPLWRALPPWTFWVLPAAVVAPIVSWSLRYHPMTRS